MARLLVRLLPDSLQRPPDEEVQGLEGDLRDLRSSSLDLSKEDDSTSTCTHKCLMSQLRELSYDAEDILEMVRLWLTPGGCSWQVSFIKSKMRRQQLRFSAKDISELRCRIKDAKDLCQAFRQSTSSTTTIQNSCRLQAEPNRCISSDDSLEPRGRLDEAMDKLVQMLALESDHRLKVVAVHGSAGVGKTTLARRLYHYYEGRFHFGAFLLVSQKPDTRKILASVLSQIKGRQCQYHGFQDEQYLIDNIKQHLQGKSYLIVVDDLWDISEWDILCRAFPKDNCCCRIITTTQVRDVALSCCSNHTEHVLEMLPLNPDQSVQLFKSRVRHMESNSEQFIEASRGSPLAIINIAGMLAGWPDIGMNELKYIQSFLFSTLSENPSSNGMEGILTLIYNNLPPKLKTCLLYLSMFPEYYIIRKDDLIRQWAAEGIFSEVDGQGEELTANIYFHELLNRGLIQSADTDYNNQVVSCTVHHMVRDFIAQKSMLENFTTVVDYHETVTGLLDNKVRRLSVSFGGVKCAKIPESLRISQVRSLRFSGFFKCVPSLVEYWLLRVLVLHIWSDEHKRIVDLSMIGDLIQLRYVRVKCNKTVKLPSMIRGLQYLQTLDVNARVAAVPVDIFCLPHLLHLRIPCEPFLSFPCGHIFWLRCLNKLNCLLDLHLTCSAAVPRSHIVSNIKCLSLILGKFDRLKSLILDGEPTSDGSIISCDTLSSVAYPPPGIERFVLSPRTFMMSRLPQWMGDLRKSLCTLKIAVKELSDNDIGTLLGLHQLAALSLYVRTTPEERIIFSRGFQVLKYFKFVCTVPCLQFEREAMPVVETLKLRFSANTMQQYSLVDARFEHLEALKLFCAKIEDAGADQARRNDAKRQMHQMVSAFREHPPVINVQFLESSFYNEKEHSAIDVIKRGSPDKQHGIRENDSMNDINRAANRNRITSPEYSLRMQKPGWVCRRPRNAVRLVKTVRGLKYVVRQHMKQPGFRLTNEVATLDQDMERLKMITDSSSPGSRPQEWVLQVQDLTYDIQDFIDIYSWLRTRSRRHTIAHMSHIVQLKDRIRTVREWQQSGISSHGGSSGIAASSGPPWSCPYTDGDVLVGIEEPMSEIMEMLLLPQDFEQATIEPLRASSAEGESVVKLMPLPTERQKPRVVSIIGYPGIGKTALARAVYNHPRVRSAFNTCVAWIGASECSNLGDLQNKILKQVESNFYSTTLEGILQNERFLVVIDDLQAVGMWYGIQSVFPKTHHGSRIIVTTSIGSVATACSPEGRYIYRMRGLDYFASEKLFWTRVGSHANRTPALEYTLGDTLRKCGGVPLALISVANHLCLKDQNLPHGSSEAFEDMNRTLTQSYHSLPDNGHRMCLLSLSTFPHGHLIKRKMLIRKWVAEGLALGDGELNPEQVASNIFDVLIDRNIIEPVLIGNNSKAKGCLVLGVIKDFINNKAVSKEFATMISNDELLFPNKKIARPVRRLFVHGGTTHSQGVAKGIILDRVRSLTICNTVPFDFQGCCLLRVLDLEACQGVDKRVLHNICKLVFLKYLSLRGSDVYKISKKIKKLQCLEMLDIRETRVETLPIEVFMLPRLVHLFGKFELPRQVIDRTLKSKLQAFFSEKSRLQTISGFVMEDNNEFACIIFNARSLRKVKVWCNHTITFSCQKRFWSSIQERVKGKNALESISIDFGNKSINFLNDIGAPYALISSIKLRGRLISLPTFMSSHDTTLSMLELSSTRLSIDALSLLQSLRQLTYLKLVDGDGFWGDCFIVRSDGFPSLLRMCFEAPELPQVDIHQGGMSSLTCLQLLCPVFASCKNIDLGERSMGVQQGEELKVVNNDPGISSKEVSSEIKSEEIEETNSKKGSMESFMENLEQRKRRFDLKKHFRGIEHLQHLSKLVLHPSVSHEVFDACKKEARSHINKPKVTIRGRNMVAKEEEYLCFEQEYEMMDEEPDTRFPLERSSERDNKQADRVPESSSLRVASPGPHVQIEIVEEAGKFASTIEEDIITEQTETHTTATDEQKQKIHGKKQATPKSDRLILELRKYILLLASLVASATYAAGFSPPGGVWQDMAGGHVVGDPIIGDTHHKRYLVFFYCNATAFAASLFVMVLVLIPASLGNNSSSKIVRSYKTVMVLNLLSLMGAYAAGSSRDTIRTCSSVLLVAAVVASTVLEMLVSFCFIICGFVSIRVPEAKEEELPKKEERFRKVLMLLAVFAVSTTYLAGLNTPGGVWETNGAGHTPGDAIIKDHNNAREELFFYCNTTAFNMSLLIIMVLLGRKLRKARAYILVVTTLVCLVVSYVAGSSRRADTTVYVVSLVAAVLVYIMFLGLVAPTIHAIWKAIISRTRSNGRKEKAAGSARSHVLLLATLTATVTFLAGLHPPGGIWQDTRDGHKAGDPILLTTNARQYNAFFYCNSISFVASLVAIVLVQKNVLLRHYVLETVIILDLFGLIGAYTAGNCWDPETTIYAMVLAGGVVGYVAILVIITLCQDNAHVLLDKTRKRFLLFATLVATITYQAGLSPPGGFLHQDENSRHPAGSPLLLYNFPRHYKAFFYSNAVSFMTSIVFTVNLLVNPNLFKGSARRFMVYVYMELGLVGLMGAFAAGSSQHFKTSIYVLMLEAAVASFIILQFIVLSFTGNHTTTQGAALMETNTQDDEKATKRKGIHAKRKYLMLLGILAASVTYKAGLEPPGGAWKSSSEGIEAGNPIMHDIRRPRYLAFFYSNSISFMASIAIILLLLVPEKLLGQHKACHRRWPVVMNTTIVLDLLGLLVAYAAGSSRELKTSIYFFLLVMMMVSIAAVASIAIHHLLPGISKRNLTAEQHNQVQQRSQV